MSQTINWSSLQKDQRHIGSITVGFDYGFVYGVGYCYHLDTTLPVVVDIEHAQPAGKKPEDDFKDKLGVQMRVYKTGNFQIGLRAQGVFRRYENKLVRMVNFGSDFAATAGLYKPRWMGAGEFGFDKAIITHFRHNQTYLESYAQAKNGWYKPATGGNFYYGIQVGYSFAQNDVMLKIGKAVSQDFKSTPLIPLYFTLSYNRRFGGYNR